MKGECIYESESQNEWWETRNMQSTNVKQHEMRG